jgi:hypothetical protein
MRRLGVAPRMVAVGLASASLGSAGGIGPNPCPSGKTCRYADAVLYAVPSSFTSLAYGRTVATPDSTNLFSGGSGSSARGWLLLG